MKPTTYKSLLKDLQKLGKALVIAYTDDVRATPALQARVTRQWHEAEVGGHFDAYLDVVARRSMVQLLLRTVYVRVLEDLGALTPHRIRGQWGLDAFRQVAPGLGLGSYLSWVFRDLAHDLPALFTPADTELPMPSDDVLRPLWDLWHRQDGKTGELTYVWDAATEDGKADFDSRFLGDLYEQLMVKATRKKFGLFQTPRFVESYILDYALTPALAEFDPSALNDAGESFRLLDPTCGSGHFLIGAFERLANWWRDEQSLSEWDACIKALDSVWGVDLNPHSIDVAHFRLLLEVRKRTGRGEIEQLAALEEHLHLSVMDSLIPWECASNQQELFPGHDRLREYATPCKRKRHAAFLGREFHVVVGNPPYVAPKDKGKSDDYRLFWPDSAFGRYSLCSPFIERFLTLATSDGFVGLIDGNNFMTREFGRKLITDVLPKWDLTGVIDTSGAYIPGHGTPTVILFARARQPPKDEPNVFAILGKRGEPSRPKEASKGSVWSAISDPLAKMGDDSPFVTRTRIPRVAFGKHPWSLQGGGASSLRQHLETMAQTTISVIEHGGIGKPHRPRIGNMTKPIEDDPYFSANPAVWRDAGSNRVNLTEGTFVRDYAVEGNELALYPYPLGGSLPLDLPTDGITYQHFWPYRVWLWNRRSRASKFAALHTIEDARFYEYPFYAPYTYRGSGITFAFVATHNHFVLARGGSLFKQSSPVIKLHSSATEDDHLDLLGLLNSSTLGFWMKQVFHNKGYGASGDGARTTAQEWENFYEYDSTKLKKAPLTTTDRAPRIALARALDATAQDRAACLPAAILADTEWTPTDLADRLSTARTRYAELTHRMVALQEELDWLTYGSYRLLDPPLPTAGPEDIDPLPAGHRPFEILAARRDEAAKPEERSAWWSRHGHPRVTDIPVGTPERLADRTRQRMAAIEADDKVALLETFPFKRRWQTPDLDKETRKATASWLLDRLEDLFADGGSLSKAQPYRLEDILAALTRDPRVVAVAAVHEGTIDLDLPRLVEKLLASDAMPDHDHRIYTASGLRKREEWRKVWALQDREDAGEDVGTIEPPPKYTRTDFRHADLYSIRGKLDVPRERFLRFGELDPVQWGWNGWRDTQRAEAQSIAYERAESHPEHPLSTPTADDPRRCGATLGLWQSLDDVKRWGEAQDHAEFRDLAEEACQQSACPCALVEKWQAWADGKLEIRAPEPTTELPTVTVEERALVVRLIAQFGTSGATLAVLGKQADAPAAAQLSLILEDLVASGHLLQRGTGARTVWTLRDAQPKLL